SGALPKESLTYPSLISKQKKQITVGSARIISWSRASVIRARASKDAEVRVEAQQALTALFFAVETMLQQLLDASQAGRIQMDRGNLYSHLLGHRANLQRRVYTRCDRGIQRQPGLPVFFESGSFDTHIVFTNGKGRKGIEALGIGLGRGVDSRFSIVCSHR